MRIKVTESKPETGEGETFIVEVHSAATVKTLKECIEAKLGNSCPASHQVIVCNGGRIMVDDHQLSDCNFTTVGLLNTKLSPIPFAKDTSSPSANKKHYQSWKDKEGILLFSVIKYGISQKIDFSWQFLYEKMKRFGYKCDSVDEFSKIYKNLMIKLSNLSKPITFSLDPEETRSQSAFSGWDIMILYHSLEAVTPFYMNWKDILSSLKGHLTSGSDSNMVRVKYDNLKKKLKNLAMDFFMHEADPSVFIEDVDIADQDVLECCSEYVKEIYQYLQICERKYKVRPLHLSKQNIKIPQMRSVLINWLVKVHQEYEMLQETLYLTVNILDRFLQERTISHSNLQLLGVTAMLIASKYEENKAPKIEELINLTDNIYEKDDVLKMERLMLFVLRFNLGAPLPLHFLRRYSKVGDVDYLVYSMAKYLTELTLTEYNLASLVPSELASAALCLSLKILKRGIWSEELAFYSSYTEAELKPVMSKICQVLLKPPQNLKAIRIKYAASKFFYVSSFPELQSDIVWKLGLFGNV